MASGKNPKQTGIESTKPKPAKLMIRQSAVAQLPANYNVLLEDLKERIQAARIKAALAVNRELVLLYWDIGARILEQQKAQGWGTKVVERLAQDLRSAFPQMKGFSRANLLYMRAFADAYPDFSIVQQVAGLIPWFHNVILIEKVKDPIERLWYAQKTVEHGWSRAVLVHQIESGLYRRQGRAVTNFDKTLPPPQSDLAKQTVKDPYIFDFLAMTDDAAERELEKGLIEQIRNFMLELGAGFAFVGSQYHLEVEGEDFYIDLLFYHLRLRCFVAIDLKVEKFRPEFAGKMNFYLAAVDDMLRHPDDNPSIGIIICKMKKRLIAEYALRNTKTPIGVSEYRLTASLPRELKGSLPSIEEIEAELSHSQKTKGEKR